MALGCHHDGVAIVSGLACSGSSSAAFAGPLVSARERPVKAGALLVTSENPEGGGGDTD